MLRPMAFHGSFSLIELGLAALLVGFACDPTEPGPEPTGECAAAEATSVSFTLELGGFSPTGDNFDITSECSVSAGLPELTLECVDGPDRRTVRLKLSASETLAPPIAVGDNVVLAVWRKAEAPNDRGFWAVRDPEGELLLGGAHSFSSVPASQPEFFAPLAVAVDFKSCDERKTDSCKLEQRVILEVGDEAATTRVPHGVTAGLPSGHQVLVARALLMMASGDAKVCDVDPSTPETYRYVIAAP